MRARAIGNLVVGIVLFIGSGCVIDSADPLLFDEDGYLRLEVGAEEVEVAGIYEDCADLSLEAGTESIRIPIEDSDGSVLVGVGGLALCIDSDNGGGLDDLDVDEDGGLDEDAATDLEFDGTNDSEDDDSGSTVGLSPGYPERTGNGTVTIPMPTVKSDPTPEPSGE